MVIIHEYEIFEEALTKQQKGITEQQSIMELLIYIMKNVDRKELVPERIVNPVLITTHHILLKISCSSLLPWK